MAEQERKQVRRDDDRQDEEAVEESASTKGEELTDSIDSGELHDHL